MRIRNLRPFAVEIPDVAWVDPGGEVDVPDELANGIPASGDPSAPDYYPGTSGLLAQEDNWVAVKGKKHNDAPAAGEEG